MNKIKKALSPILLTGMISLTGCSFNFMEGYEENESSSAINSISASSSSENKTSSNSGSSIQSSSNSNSSTSSSSSNTINIGKITIWCDANLEELTSDQLNIFKSAHPDYEMKFTIQSVSESTAAIQAYFDPEESADLFFFSQDQLPRLVRVGALSKLGNYDKHQIQDINEAGSVSAVTINGDAYAYPATSDIGYFMYYDKSIFQNTDMTDFEAIAAKAKQAGKKIYFNYSSAWYNASFFLAAGAYSNFITDNYGNFVEYEDTYNTTAGKAAATALHDLIKDQTVFVDDAQGIGFNKGAAVVISGTWDEKTVKDALGDNMGVTILPKVMINGKATQLSSFAGYKMLGMKPQKTRDRKEIIRELALFLTNEEAQMQRLDYGWLPSNKNAQASPEVQNNPVYKALLEQNAFAHPQGMYPGEWWSLAGELGTGLARANADINKLLKDYENGLDALLS